ncbi:MAG: hypothetical protein NTW21_40205 [Verrucomicrobia bacterium]|nr:hypothetical protein [Verrucomicrobiota bacterium]
MLISLFLGVGGMVDDILASGAVAKPDAHAIHILLFLVGGVAVIVGWETPLRAKSLEKGLERGRQGVGWFALQRSGAADSHRRPHQSGEKPSRSRK